MKAKRLHDWRGVAYGKWACQRCGVLLWNVIDAHTKAARRLYSWGERLDFRMWTLDRPDCPPREKDQTP